VVCRMLDYNNNQKVTIKELEEFVESVCVVNNESKTRKQEMVSCAKQLFDKNMKDEDIVPLGDALSVNHKEIIEILEEKIEIPKEEEETFVEDEYEFSDEENDIKENEIKTQEQKENSIQTKQSFFLQFDGTKHQSVDKTLELLVEKKLNTKLGKSRFKSLSIEDLKARGKNNSDFLTCFGFFNVLNSIVTNIFNMVEGLFLFIKFRNV
jgi:hypothetical protein